MRLCGGSRPQGNSNLPMLQLIQKKEFHFWNGLFIGAFNSSGYTAPND
jgi:hypothetical protein